MDRHLFELYTDYLLASFGPTTATGMSRAVDHEISHDKITRMLASEKLTAKDWWRMVKPEVRRVQAPDAVLAFDDSIEAKPHTDENEIVCWHYDHSKGRTVKGINFLTAHYVTQEVSLPVSFELVEKTEWYTDKKGRERRRSATTKNERFRNMVAACVKNKLPIRYVLADSWYAAVDNMRFLKLDLKLDFIFALKSNRKVALSFDEKQAGKYTKLNELYLPEATPTTIYLEKVPFALLLVKQVFTNKDGSTGVRYLVTSDLTLDFSGTTTIYQKRWKVEEYHRSLKQNASLEKSPTRNETTQTNHFVAAMWAWCKLELLSVHRASNHYALKSHLYITALKVAFYQLRILNAATPAA